MRGITISRLSATRAVLAGALLAGASWHDAAAGAADQAQTPEETALAMPRVKLPAGPGGLGLPQPLPPSEAARVRRIFTLQRGGDIPAAIAETGRLNDDTLLGYILADRLLRRAGRAAAPELSAWLKRYADLPDASTVYAVLLKKLPAGAPRPAPPVTPASAEPDFGARETAGPARDAFARGRDDAAYRLGRAAWRRSNGRDAQAAYVAGLAAWRRNDTAAAQAMFEAAADCPDSGGGLRAAAAFWAARAHAQSGDIPGWRPWMLRAAAEPQAFHGILARKALGIALPAQPRNAELGQADLDSVSATPQGRRGFALLQVGEIASAEAEFRLLWRNNLTDAALGRAIFLIARTARLEDLQANLSGEMHFADTAAKLPSLRPNGGFTLDPALVYAVARVESNFDPHAGSVNDAHGLMQVRPEVASFLVHGSVNLRDPGINLKIGQRYLSYLSAEARAGDDLLHVLAAYNAGPSALQRWKLDTEDPLMFIEALPIDETRRYVQSTLTYLWRYAARMGLPAPSLDALALDAWPKFTNEVTRLH